MHVFHGRGVGFVKILFSREKAHKWEGEREEEQQADCMLSSEPDMGAPSHDLS